MEELLRQELLRSGVVRVFDADSQAALIRLANVMRKEGHAVIWDFVEIDNRVTSYTCHHYMGCTACRKSVIDYTSEGASDTN